MDPDSYQTPFGHHAIPSIQYQLNQTRIFYPKKKKYKKNLTYPNHILSSNHNHSQVLPKSQKAALSTLAEWLRLSTLSLGVGKHVFDSALALLKQGSHKMQTTYALAAASLVIAAKFEHGTMISRHRQLPLRTANRVPKVQMSDATRVQGHLLNVIII